MSFQAEFNLCFEDAFREVFGEEVPTTRSKRKSFQGGAGNYKWRQKGGVVIDMEEMSVRHLKNALRICELTRNTGKADQLQEVLARKEVEELYEDFDELEDENELPPGHPDEML